MKNTKFHPQFCSYKTNFVEKLRKKIDLSGRKRLFVGLKKYSCFEKGSYTEPEKKREKNPSNLSAEGEKKSEPKLLLRQRLTKFIERIKSYYIVN